MFVQFLYFIVAVAGDLLQVALPHHRWRVAVRTHVDRFFLLFWTTTVLVGGVFHIFLFVQCAQGDCAWMLLTDLWLLHGEMLWYALPEALLVPHGVSESRIHDVILSISLAFSWYVFFWLYYAVTGGQYVYGSIWPIWELVCFVPGHVFVMFVFRVIWRLRQLYYRWCRNSGRSHWIWELDQRGKNMSTPIACSSCPRFREVVPALIPFAVSMLFVAALTIYLHLSQINAKP
jgi:hypothetical protein